MGRTVRTAVLVMALAAVPLGASGAAGAAAGATQASPEDGDQFGAAVATGDFDGNNADNLVVGVPGEDVGTVQDAGAVISLCGSEGLMQGCADGVLTQANPETADLYGATLTDGKFDGNELTDLAVGAPGETVGGAVAAGAAAARDGNIGGLQPSSSRRSSSRAMTASPAAPRPPTCSPPPWPPDPPAARGPMLSR